MIHQPNKIQILTTSKSGVTPPTLKLSLKDALILSVSEGVSLSQQASDLVT